jgi:hypothetical protein
MLAWPTLQRNDAVHTLSLQGKTPTYCPPWSGLIYHIPYFIDRQAGLIPYCKLTASEQGTANTQGYESKTLAERGIGETILTPQRDAICWPASPAHTDRKQKACGDVITAGLFHP